MALTETQVVANELETVVKKLPVLFEREDTFFASIEKKNVETVSNRDMRIPLELRPGGTFGHFDPAGGDLGRGEGPEFDKAVVSVQHLKYAVEYQKKAEWATDDSRKAILNTVKHLTAKAMAEFRRSIDCLCMTAGNGVLGTVSSVSNAANVDTVVLTSNFGARLLRHKQPVAIFDSTLATNRTTGTDKVLTYVDIPSKTIKYASAGAATAQAGDKIVVGGLGNVTGTSVVSLYGVPYHHSNSTAGSWLGFTRSATPEVLSNGVTASGSLALPFARRAANAIGDRLGMDAMKKLVAWMHPCQKQAYEELGQLVSVIQKTSANEGMDLYFGDNLQIAGAPIKTHFAWDKARIDFVDSSMWGRAEMHAPSFYEVEGRRLFEIRGSSGGVAAANIFYLTCSMQIFCMNPASGAYIDSLTIPTGY